MTIWPALLLLFVLVSVPVSSAWSQEARCNELGAQCICAEQFNTGTYSLLFSDPGGAEQWNPVDSNSTKQCSQEATNYSVIVEQGNGPIARNASNSPAPFQALPAGHQLTWVLSRAVGDGRLEAGAAGLQSVPGTGTYQQINVRWYYYHTSDFAFKGDPGSTCENTKWTEHWPNSLSNRVDYTAGLHIYSHLGWSPSLDCCQSGPGPRSGFPGSSTFAGKWFRWEIVVGPRSGSSYRFRMYGTDVTSGGPTLLYLDNMEPGSPVAGVAPPAPFNTAVTNWNRFNGAGTCPGYRAITHYMLAGFPTISESNRIGAAPEVEGSGPLNPPTQLKGCTRSSPSVPCTPVQYVPDYDTRGLLMALLLLPALRFRGRLRP